MTEKELFVDNEGWYSLLEDENGLLLAVMCGGIAMYEMKIRLTAEEFASYRELGKSYLDELARSVAYSPDRFRDRSIETWTPRFVAERA
jgi:hypothetical protein